MPPEQVKEEYMKCLRLHDNEAKSCTEVAKLYLECRMERCVEHPASNTYLLQISQRDEFLLPRRVSDLYWRGEVPADYACWLWLAGLPAMEEFSLCGRWLPGSRV